MSALALRFGLLVPGLAFIGVSFLLPLAWLVGISFSTQEEPGFTTETYALVLTDPFYWKLAGNTLMLAAMVAVLATLLSYPLGLFLARTQSRWRGVLVTLAIAPLLTSTVVRTYGWMIILSDQGLVNGTLRAAGLIWRPLALANNTTGAVIALVEILMPYAVLSILSGLGRLKPEHEEAAALHGASRLRVFLRVILPLSLPGIMTAMLLVFVLAISSFVTPRLMGGGRVLVFGTEIFNESTVTLNWPVAAVLSMLLLVIFGLIMFVYSRLMRRMEEVA
ncbi:ABC transporter permease [Humitalea sp. 24SJ18S-53]|uniref:ABC transporter permease n=1 Tax=Humitalea sp. 24SJ18S-53 TaxID=3422307 RepID=UPI003D676422